MPVFQFKRGTESETNNYIGDPGEITVIVDDSYRPVVHDGTTSGGHPLALKGEGASLLEDWEAGSSALDNYTLYDDAGATVSSNGFSVSGTDNIEGDFSLLADSVTRGEMITSEGAYTTDESKSILYQTRINDANTRSQFAFFLQDFDNYYIIDLNLNDSDISAYLKDAGNYSSTVLDSSPGLGADVLYRVEITPTGSGSFDILIKDLDSNVTVGSYSHSFSTTFTSGALGARAFDPGPTYDLFKTK